MKDGGAKAKQDEGQAVRDRVKPFTISHGSLICLKLYDSIVPWHSLI